MRSAYKAVRQDINNLLERHGSTSESLVVFEARE